MIKTMWLAMGIILANTVYGEITEIQHLSQLEGMIAAPEPTDWVLFDIDYTVTEPEHPAFHMSTLKQNKKLFRSELAKFSAEQQELIPVLMVTHFPNQLTDPCLAPLIQKLQLSGTTVLGFTAADTSVIPDVGLFPNWRTNELKRLGISFSPDSPLVMSQVVPKDRIEFPQFPPVRGSYPLYQEGILYCNVNPSKGDVLAAFLDHLNHTPSKIILVDDLLDNLVSVETELKKRDIPFHGIHYHIQVDSTSSQIPEVEWNRIWEEIRKRTQQL